MKVFRGPTRHELHEYSVQTTLWSPVYEKVYTSGDNADLVATDTQKNTVYVVAKRSDAKTPEDFGLALAKHFLREYDMLTKVEVEVEEASWTRHHEHAWLRTSPAKDAAVVTLSRDAPAEVKSQIRGLTFIKTTQSGFEGFLKDKYTKLPDCTERCLASELSAEWTYTATTKKQEDYAAARAKVKDCLLKALFGPPPKGHYSPSLQATIYDGACLVLETVPDIAQINIDTPNLHYIPATFLSQFGESFQDDVFVPTSEPSGSIYVSVVQPRK
mmetsp:Transcript_26478/g.85619  ORF Transcript_26478/g.85619 Transcript_26478/m.85619 type:complete len:272 (+) Transcript_26478:125-940(+)